MGASFKVYVSYDSESPEDRLLWNKLENQLGPLVQNGHITIWSRDQMLPGKVLESEIDAHLAESHIILLLISESFFACSACTMEKERAMAKLEANEASVIPVLLRAVDWEVLPYGKIQPLPTNRKAITSWNNQDEALLDVETGIRRIIEKEQEIQQMSQGDMKEKLYQTLVRLNYRDQATLFRQFWQQNHQAGVFLIYGAPSYGQGWLLNRLIRQLPHRSTFKPFKFSFQRKSLGRSFQDLWIELAKFVGQKNISFPINASEQQEIVNKLYNRWKTGPIILMLNNVHEIKEVQYLSKFLQDFWRPLLGMTNDSQSQTRKNYLLMFLIDHDDCVDNWSIELSHQVDLTWKPYVPLKLKKLTEFSEEVLDDWISNEFETLPSELTAKGILENPSVETPEDALDYICSIFDFLWLDLVTYQLTS